MGQFGISQPVRRREDVRLLTGSGRFCDDRMPAEPAHAYVLRSPLAHARLVRLETSAARQAPGVLAVYTGADLAADGLGSINCVMRPVPKPGSEIRERRQPLLVGDEACFVGDCVAFVVAESVPQARDAAELIEVDYQALPAVIGCDAAAQDAGKLAYEWELGDRAATAQAFAEAAHIVGLDLVNNRVVLNALETRGAIGGYDPGEDKYTLYTGTQMPHGVRDQLADAIFGVARDKIRVVTEDVGGGFGGKNSLYPEQALVLYAARKLGRTVKWIGERSEAFISDFHGRDNVSRGELAVARDGRFLALRINTYADLGAYSAARGMLSPVNVAMACNTYRLPALYINVKAAYTHTVPTDPYRGAGRPEILYLIERLVDTAAFDLGMDRLEMRRRNTIEPDAFPYTTATGLTYDYCEFVKIMDEALQRARWSTFARRREQSGKRGKLRGIGLANYVERCGGGGGLSETATLWFDAHGSLVLAIGTMSNGQGHATAYSQILSERLGLPFGKIRVLQGDTEQIAGGNGTGGSWSIPMGGGAVSMAADALIETARGVASDRLEAAVADLEFDPEQGVFRILGTDRSLSLAELAAACPDLRAEASFRPGNYTYPYGCHVCEVEIDPDTGKVDVLDYTAVHDFGRALNPLLLAGQVHGGVAQGIGQALLEHTVYDEQGQLLSGSFTDYCLPRADDLPSFVFVHKDTPSPANPLGVKGCGEAGAAGSPPALINAIVDALGVRHIDMPATPESVWRILQHGVTNG